VRVDAVYLDASHEYAEVLDDLRGVWNLIGEQGIVIADDYKAPDVQKAIREFCEQPGVYGLCNVNVPWPEAVMAKTQAMRDRAVAGHAALTDIPKLN
jgi:hypothetical protein